MMDLTVEIDGEIGTLEEALAQFTASEVLDRDNKYYCCRLDCLLVLLLISNCWLHVQTNSLLCSNNLVQVDWLLCLRFHVLLHFFFFFLNK